MDEIQIFQNEEFGRIRTIVIDGATWFCGKDVASALGYKDTKKAIARHCKERGVTKRPLLSNGGYQMSTFINEPNVYRLITHSKLEGAVRFENWIFEEVLPEIKKDLTKSLLCDRIVIAKLQLNTHKRLTFCLLLFYYSIRLEFCQVFFRHGKIFLYWLYRTNVLYKRSDYFMDEIQIFQNEEFGRIRTIVINGETWFVGVDVAKALGYTNPQDALRKHVDPEDKRILTKSVYKEFLRSQNATLEDFPNRGLLIINESGLYSLIFNSKLEGAIRFKRWVTSEVLPEINKKRLDKKPLVCYNVIVQRLQFNTQ